jgi:hypothetical protein
MIPARRSGQPGPVTERRRPTAVVASSDSGLRPRRQPAGGRWGWRAGLAFPGGEAGVVWVRPAGSCHRETQAYRRRRKLRQRPAPSASAGRRPLATVPGPDFPRWGMGVGAIQARGGELAVQAVRCQQVGWRRRHRPFYRATLALRDEGARCGATQRASSFGMAPRGWPLSQEVVCPHAGGIDDVDRGQRGDER